MIRIFFYVTGLKFNQWDPNTPCTILVWKYLCRSVYATVGTARRTEAGSTSQVKILRRQLRIGTSRLGYRPTPFSGIGLPQPAPTARITLPCIWVGPDWHSIRLFSSSPADELARQHKICDAETGAFFFFIFKKIRILKIYICFEIF